MDETEAELRDRVERFVRTNFPQIAAHGGNHAVQHLDAEAGEVTIALGGACTGCGISPMTVQALQARLPREIPELPTVHALTGDEEPPRPDLSDVPF
nr:NifU family protein [Halosegnis sp. DT85]